MGLMRKNGGLRSGGAPASGCLAHKGGSNRLPHHQQHFAVEPVGFCHKLFEIVLFNDVAVLMTRIFVPQLASARAVARTTAQAFCVRSTCLPPTQRAGW